MATVVPGLPPVGMGGLLDVCCGTYTMVCRGHPSWGRRHLPDQLLCAERGKLSPSGRGGERKGKNAAQIPPTPARWANGCSEEKPFCVPRDAPFQLETCPLTAMDALGNSPVGPGALAGWGGGGGPEPGAPAEQCGLQFCASSWSTSGSWTLPCTRVACTSSQRPTTTCWARPERPISPCSGAFSPLLFPCILPALGRAGRRHVGA